MRILSLDSSAKACSCAIFDDGRLIGESYVDIGLTHSRTLIPLMEATLKNAGLELSGIDRFAVSAGPGSFTGVRIGISVIKGLCFALDKPCVGVSTLLAMAHLTAGLYQGYVCPMMDARVGQVYAALFEVKEGQVTRLWDDAAMPVDELRDKLPDNTLLIGDGAHLLMCEGSRFMAAPPHLAVQRASGVALASLCLPDAQPDVLSPIYLRRPQAEREYLARQEKK